MIQVIIDMKVFDIVSGSPFKEKPQSKKTHVNLCIADLFSSLGIIWSQRKSLGIGMGQILVSSHSAKDKFVTSQGSQDFPMQ